MLRTHLSEQEETCHADGRWAGNAARPPPRPPRNAANENAPMEDDGASTMHSNSWVKPDAPASESALEKFKMAKGIENFISAEVYFNLAISL